MSAFRNLPVAWLQLSHGRTKLLAAVVGIVFADLLMWMQLGFLDAALASSTSVYGKLRGELVVINPRSHQINGAEPFARRLLARRQGHPEVSSSPRSTPVRSAGRTRGPGINGPCSSTESCRMPRRSRAPGCRSRRPGSTPPIRASSTSGRAGSSARSPPRLAAGEPSRPRSTGGGSGWSGTTTIGASFAVDGNLVTSDANFLRLFPGRSSGSIDVGVIRLAPGADTQQVKAELQQLFGGDLLVLTIEEFVDRDKDFLLRSRPINFIFTLGARRRLPGRLRDRLPGAVHRREQPPASLCDAQGDRLLRTATCNASSSTSR